VAYRIETTKECYWNIQSLPEDYQDLPVMWGRVYNVQVVQEVLFWEMFKEDLEQTKPQEIQINTESKRA
jgi:hypothetical protein